MKNKYVALFFSFLLSAPALLAQDIDLSKVQQQAQAASLAEAPRAVLQQYYKRSDFSGPGWYRVQDFLNFVSQNQDRLKNASVNVNGTKTPLMQLLNSKIQTDRNLAWGYLGARYVFYKFGKPFPDVNFSICADSYCRMTPEGDYYIRLNINTNEPVKLINIGFGNMIAADRIVAIVSPDSAPIKRFFKDRAGYYTPVDAKYLLIS